MMRNLALSQIYAIGAVLLLVAAIVVNQPRVTIIIAAVGLAAGALVLLRGDVRRVVIVAMAGFVAAIVMAGFSLLQYR